MCSSFLSRKEFAAALGVSIATVDRGIRDKVPPYSRLIKIGSRVLYPVQLIDELRDKALAGVASASKRGGI